jgi:uncharacterized protein (DUF1499 family)
MTERDSGNSITSPEPDAYQGPLGDCPASPNCVCTQASRNEQRMPAIAFTGTAAAVIEIIAEDIARWPRTRIVSHKSNYLHLTVATKWLRFVDDVEFLADEETHLLHFRSASRLGYSDLGVNRRRMKKLSNHLSKLLVSSPMA